MRIDRRELLRQFGGAAGVAALLPSTVKPADSAADSATRLVHLDRNENAHGPCEKAKVAFREAVMEANRYPDTEVKKLCAAVAAQHHVSAENITLGCGSTEVLRMAAETYLGPGKSLIMASPTHEAMALAAGLVGAELRSVPLTRLYGHDLEAMLAKTDSTTGLVYICNPNNPTGTLTPKADFEALLSKFPPGVSVLIDEAYHDYVAPSDGYASWAAHAAANPRWIVTRTFSKAYGLAGLRAGYAVSSIETAKRLAARRLPIDVNAVAARVALAALGDPEYVKKIALLNADDRQEFYNQANARMLRSLDSQTNFVLLATGRPGTEVAELLRSHQVLVTSGYPYFENYIRVSLGLAQDMKAFWRAWDASMPHHPM